MSGVPEADYCVRLGTFLALNDVELDLIALFQSLVSVQLDGYKTLKEGDEVEFDIVQGQKGPQADSVVRYKDAAHTAA